MRRKKRERIVNIKLKPVSSNHRQPGVYIHYLEGEVQYVGETVNVLTVDHLEQAETDQ